MSKRPRPAHCYPTGWIVRGISISVIILLAAASQVRPVAAPPSAPEVVAPELTGSLVSFAVLTPTHQPEPTPNLVSTTTAVPTVAEEQVTASQVAFIAEMPDPQPKAAGPRVTPITPIAHMLAAPMEAPAPAEEAGLASVPILMYHYISDSPPGSDRLRYSLSVTPANFDAQLFYLQQAGYQAITLNDLYEHLIHAAPLPDRPIILTFDDGYVDAFTFALPILQKHGFAGTFFILSGPADRNGEGGHLNWAQITAMSQAGMDMELHSREHDDLRNRPNDFLVYQIAGGRDSLEARTGQPVRWFSYPSGRYDAAVVRVLQSAGFVGAVTTLQGRTQMASGLFDLQRIRINGSDTLETFIKAVAGNP